MKDDETMHRGFLFLTSASGGMVGYMVAFSLLLESKFIRHAGQTAGQEAWLVTEVLLGSLTVILTLTAVVLAYVDREVAKRLLLIVTVLAVPLVALATAGFAVPLFQPPQGLERFYATGLIIGNAVVVSSNIAAFYELVPGL